MLAQEVNYNPTAGMRDSMRPVNRGFSGIEDENGTRRVFWGRKLGQIKIRRLQWRVQELGNALFGEASTVRGHVSALTGLLRLV